MVESLSRASSLSFDAWSEGQCLSVVYVLPYVDPSARCCVPPRRASRTSRARTLAEGRLLEDVCRWHADQLARISPR